MSICKKKDLFNTEILPVKELLRKSIDLKSNEYELPTLKIPSNFKKTQVELPEKLYGPHIRSFLEPYAQYAEKKGFNYNVFTALYEGVLNAHQHGNKLSEEKNILFASLCNKKSLEFIVCDSGDILPEHFISFVLSLRLRNLGIEGVIDWYEHSGQEKPNTNNGTGSSFMHIYMDTIKYFRSEDTGGLAVYMAKFR